MGFRNPATTATAVDTGQGNLADPGVRLYQDVSNPSVPQGIAEWRTGLMDRNARITLAGGLGGSALTIDGGADEGINAPTLTLEVQSAPDGGYQPTAWLTTDADGLITLDPGAGGKVQLNGIVAGSLPGRPLVIAGNTSAAAASGTTPVTLPGVGGSLTLTAARYVVFLLNAGTVTGGSGGELGRITLLNNGVEIARTQWQNPSGGAAGAVSPGLHTSARLAAGTYNITATVLKVIGGSSVTVSSCLLTVLDGGPA